MNPAKLPLPKRATVTAQTQLGERYVESFSGIRQFSSALTDATGQIVRSVSASNDTVTVVSSDGTTALVGDARVLGEQPLLPLALIEDALTNDRTGVALLTPGATTPTGVRLYLHTSYWQPGMKIVGTLAIDIYFDSVTFLPGCENMLLRVDADAGHVIPHQMCFADYRTEGGWNVPHTVTDLRAGRIVTTTTVSAMQTQ